MPSTYRIIIAFYAAVALALGGFAFFTYYGQVVHGAEQDAAKITAYIERGATKALPVVSNYIGWSTTDVVESFTEAGENIVDLGYGAGSLNIIRVSPDMDANEASSLYSEGIAALSAVEGAKLLGDYWHLDGTGDGDDGENLSNLRLRYVDFTSGDVSSAINACLAAQGIDGTANEEGEDESGNTYKTGSVTIDGTACTWRVSAITFSKVYDIDLPETAIYTGFRLIVD